MVSFSIYEFELEGNQFALIFLFRWGYLSRAGLWDKSHLMRQIEKYVNVL